MITEEMKRVWDDVDMRCHGCRDSSGLYVKDGGAYPCVGCLTRQVKDLFDNYATGILRSAGAQNGLMGFILQSMGDNTLTNLQVIAITEAYRLNVQTEKENRGS